MYKKVIIIGAPRSGTNMLRDVLCSLDGVETWPCDEINYIWRHGNTGVETDEFSVVHATKRVKAYVNRQFDKQAVASKAQFLVEKTCANSLRVEFVNKIAPDAHFVYIKRNGLDVVASARLRWQARLDIPYLLKKTRFVPLTDLPVYAVRYLAGRVYRRFSAEKRVAFWGPRLLDMKQLLARYSLLEVCAIQWTRCIENSERAFAEISPDRVTRVRYEEFVNSPAVELKRIAEQCGIEVDEQTITKAISRISNNSVGKWRSEVEPENVEAIRPHISATMAGNEYSI